MYRDKSKSVQVIYTGTNKKTTEVKTNNTFSLVDIKDKLASLITLNNDPIEDTMKAELGETDDPYCKTGSCGGCM